MDENTIRNSKVPLRTSIIVVIVEITLFLYPVHVPKTAISVMRTVGQLSKCYQSVEKSFGSDWLRFLALYIMRFVCWPLHHRIVLSIPLQMICAVFSLQQLWFSFVIANYSAAGILFTLSLRVVKEKWKMWMSTSWPLSTGTKRIWYSSAQVDEHWPKSFPRDLLIGSV